MSGKTRQHLVLPFATVATFFIAIALFKQHLPHARGYEEDQWRFAHRPASWNLITRIQRYPLFTGEGPDWETLAGHEDPFVRAAVALAIGREAAPENIRLLTPLLNDEFQLTRKSALWALMQFRGLSIKEPLFSVIGSWEYLVEDNGSILPGDSSRLVQFFKDIALPPRLLGLPLADRRAWLRTTEATKWIPTLEAPEHRTHEIRPLSKKASISFNESIWNAGDKVVMRVRSARPTFSDAKRARITGRGDWYAVNMAGQIATSSEHTQRRRLESELLEFDPNGFILSDHPLTPEESLSPGIYLFYFMGDIPGGSLHLARVQRSEAAEESIPNLLKQINDSNTVGQSKTISLVAQQRVKAALPKLIELFRENGAKSDNPLNFKIAEAFGRIGDPRAVPLLLEYPFLRNFDVLGDTSTVLKSFGSNAHPHCEQHILAWKDTVSRYIASVEPKPNNVEHSFQSDQARGVFALEMSLRILGAEGSVAVDKARLELIGDLASDCRNLMQEEYLPIMVTLRTAVVAAASKHPDDAVEALWAARGCPAVVREILSELRRPQIAGAGPVCLGLWKRLQNDTQKYPEIESYMTDKVLPRVAPHFKP